METGVSSERGNGNLLGERVLQDNGKSRRGPLSVKCVSRLTGPGFVDVAAAAFAGCPSFREQMLHGIDYWRTVLDGACGIDVYANNGIAAGDFDGDGFDDLYVCQPAGLPNRLYRNRGDGTFEDATVEGGVRECWTALLARFSPI